MAWGKKASFTGGSGQMAVMGELLHRKCNAAIPHVDIGMDVFEFRNVEDGTHYVVNRANAERCMMFDQFVAFTSAHMADALGRLWARPGVC